MKKLLPLLILLFSIISLSSFSQQVRGRINGTVIDGDTKTIESANITLLKAKDSSLVKISTSNKTGKFSFENIVPGKYLVSISAVAHVTGYSEIVSITKD